MNLDCGICETSLFRYAVTVILKKKIKMVLFFHITQELIIFTSIHVWPNFFDKDADLSLFVLLFLGARILITSKDRNIFKLRWRLLKRTPFYLH